MFASAIKKGRTSEDRSRWVEGVAVQHARMLYGHDDAFERIQDHQEQRSSGQYASGVYGWRTTCVFTDSGAEGVQHKRMQHRTFVRTSAHHSRGV